MAVRYQAFIILTVLAAFIPPACAGCSTTPPEPSTAVVLSVSDKVGRLPEGDASPPDVVPVSPAGAPGFSHYVFEDIGGQVVTTMVEGPAQAQVRLPLSYQELKSIHAGKKSLEGLDMSARELEVLVGQLDTIREATQKYLDVDLARADGYIRATEDVPNMGAHFVHPVRSLDGVFDPAHPEILLYTQDEELGWRLVGTSFVLPTQMVGNGHPEAFAGPLDNWHVHYNLCTGPGDVSRSSTPAECSEKDSIWVPSYGWMIHAWIWEDNPMGVFSMWNPTVPPVIANDAVRQSREAVSPEFEFSTASIENFTYTPSEIGVGETLTWTNVDGVPHTVTTGFELEGVDFDSGLIGPGQSFAVRFNEPGQYQFACTLHPFMSGTVLVSE